ncbi:hypothetical protein NQ314_006540 [Rhamnusium bicolor]|uniref:TFIIS N-terminal domain-containing protein n=1 Tax=Rhamnusium bicolor TaxID=1586634 RepID=A0AAV8Z335_9CUCU|nr:hypothetical protein NQ314_006540 [Rhamnusium bicolor]
MGTSNEELMKTIRYYQQGLDKYASFGNNYKIMSIVGKLKRLPIAIAHLEKTGIGRTVNGLRKLGGDVGEAADSLVARWKDMVMKEEKDTENAVNEPVSVPCPTNEKDINSSEKKENSGIEEDSQCRKKESSSSHKTSDTERKDSEKHETDKSKYSNNSSSRSFQEKKDKENSNKKRRQESDSSSDEHSPQRHHDSSGFESEEVYESKHSKSKNEERKRKSISDSSEDEEDQKHKLKKSKHSKDSSDSEGNYKKNKRSSKLSRDHSSNKSKSKEKTEYKRQDYDSSSDRDENKSKSKHKSDSKSKRDSDCEEGKTSSKHKSRKSYESSSDKEVKHKSKHESKSRHDKESSSKSKESRSHSSRSDKHEKKDKKESKREESKEKHSHKKEEPRKHEEKLKKSKDERENDKKEKSSSSHRPEESKSSSSSSNHRSSSEKKSKEKGKVSMPANTKKIMNGIDSGSGASFAEALGMCGPLVSKSSSSGKKKSSSEKSKSSSSYVKPEYIEMVEEDDIPSLLKEQPPEPLNLNISGLLPEITPNYRPVGFPVDMHPKKLLTQDEALSQVISNKNMRTKVYSGNKCYGKVETLFDLCVRVLQDNIDALEYTGGVPYLILKPVLDKATPDQLFNMEHHNPYLIEDTDELWLLHCQKEFRNKKREELESWREMYMRCLDEREAKLNAITANIKQSQDKSTPQGSRPKMVSSLIRNRAQTPASRVASLASSGGAKKAVVPNPASKAVERSSTSSSTAAMKPKKAPLMAKTLSFLKNRYRR